MVLPATAAVCGHPGCSVAARPAQRSHLTPAAPLAAAATECKMENISRVKIHSQDGENLV